MREKFKKQKGITLIALIITIIIMLILAIVSINIIVNQGIITKSKTAVDEHQIAAEKEAIKIGYSEYIADKYSGKTPLELKVENEQVSEQTDEGWTITFNKTGNVYKLSADGKTIEGPLTGDNAGENEGTLTDEEMQAALQSFTANPESYVHPEQSSTNKNRAIGTDGQAVNMDLWDYTISNEDNKEIMLADNVSGCAEGSGYSNDDIVDGKIQGTVPQYIYIDERNEIYTVTSMRSTFGHCTNLVQAPILPSTVTDMQGTFYCCTNLTKAPNIPNGVTNLYWTFYKCTSLTQAPAIPSSVTNMENTFYNCTSLTQAPTIPSSVTNMYGTFYHCTSLIQAPTIPNSVTNMEHIFYNCTSLTQAPEIPSSVTSMLCAFYNCTSLTGRVRINASNINDVINCFYNITNNITVQVPANSTTYNAFNSAYGSSSNIKIETF